MSRRHADHAGHSAHGKRLNAPNDVVVKSDGSIWFSDPLYGLLNDYEGGSQLSEQPPALYRLDPDTGEVTADGQRL